MKRLSLTAVIVVILMFTFYIQRLNANEQQAPAGSVDGISMDFKDANLKDILKAFSMQSGLNFIASEAVQERKVTLYLDHVPLTQAMDKIFSANNLSYDLDKNANIFVVKEWGKMGTETVTKVFYLKNATVSTSALKADMLKNATSSNISDTGDSESGASSSGGGKWKVDEESGITSVVKRLLSNTSSSASGSSMSETSMSGSGGSNSGTSGFKGSVIEDFRTNSLIVTDTPAKMKVISEVIASLDVPISQVMLEVEMLDVSKDVVDKIGFEFGDTPFTAIVTGATASMGFPYGGWGNITNGGKGSLSINPSGSTYQAQLDFIRTQTDTKFLARPKLLTLNNETAEISITKDEIVGREDTVVESSSGTTTTSTFKRSTDLALTKEGTGIFLRVTPQINIEAGEITMVVNPKSSVTSISDLSTESNQQADVEIRSTKSIVKVRDGETVVLGGLIHQDKTVAIKKLPILGDLPLVGMFFRHKDQTVGLQREVLVFITPRIIKDKIDIKVDRIQSIQLPIREQGPSLGATRDYIINSNMNKFEKKH